MKKIKIFLASSIEDLRDDRLQVGDYFRQLNEIYIDNGIYFSLVKCEDYDNAIAAGGKQSAYDAEIRDSALVFFLFFRKVGEYTRHEFEVALEAFRETNKPKIVTYFKDVASGNEVAQNVHAFMQMLDTELHHYYNTYGHIDTLKLGMLMQIKLMKLDSLDMKIKDGEVLLGSHPVAKCENVPLLDGNGTLKELTLGKQQLQKELSEKRERFLENQSEENESAFFAASAKLNEVSKQLTEIEKQTLALLSAVCEMTSGGKVLTHRQKQALDYFNKGQYDKAQAILDDPERENELARAEGHIEFGKKEIQGHIEEDLLWIKAEQAKGVTSKRASRIIERYEKAVSLTEKHDLSKDVLYGFASFLYDQKDYGYAIKVAEKLKWYYENPNAELSEADRSRLYNLLGILYSRTERFDDAEELYKKSLAIRQRLSEKDPEAHTPDLAMICNNLGSLYKNTGRFAQAEEMYQKSLAIWQRLSEKDPEAHTPDLAMICNNLGSLYKNTGRFAQAEEMYQRSLAIRQRLSEKDPEAYTPDLAMSCNGLGTLYSDTGRLEEAEEMIGKALAIRQRLAEKNPEAHTQDLATSCNNLGILYKNIGRLDEAEEMIGKAMAIYERLAVKNPAAYTPNLAGSCNSLGNLYKKTGRYDKTEEMYKKVMAIMQRLSEGSPEAHTPDLAMSCNNLGILYYETGRLDEAEEMFGKALAIKQPLAEKSPEAYEQSLASTCYNLGALYSDTGRLDLAEEMYGRALEIRQRLAEKSPEAHAPALAEICNSLGIIYNNTGHFAMTEDMYKKAIAIYERLAEKKPEGYAQSLADALWNLGFFYKDWSCKEAMKSTLARALAVYERLEEQNPGRHSEDIEALQSALSEE